MDQLNAPELGELSYVNDIYFQNVLRNALMTPPVNDEACALHGSPSCLVSFSFLVPLNIIPVMRWILCFLTNYRYIENARVTLQVDSSNPCSS